MGIPCPELRASSMKGSWRVTITSTLTAMFSGLLQLSSKGKDVGSCFSRGDKGAVSCPKVQVLGCGAGWTGLVAAVGAQPESPAGLREQCGSQDSWVVMLGLS